MAALLIELEVRLTDFALDMMDKLIGNAFARAKNTKERTYVATTKDVGRLMRLFNRTIEALSQALGTDRDAFAVVDETVGWVQLLRARPEIAGLAALAGEDPLVRAADRYATLRKFAPALLDVLEFKAAKGNDPILAAITLLRSLNQSGKREVPPDAPLPFRKEWRRLVTETGKPNRRLYETAVLATLRNKLRSGDVWVERSSNYSRFDPHLDLPTSRKIVFVEKPLRGTEPEQRKWHRSGVLAEVRSADIGNVVISAMDAKAVQMIVIPPMRIWITRCSSAIDSSSASLTRRQTAG